MSEFSVKKPFTVFVAVIAVLVLGVVAYLKMTPDLLPNMDFPYVMIMTTYPGASPEKVEGEVSKPMEQSMATLDHIKNVTSTSSENYSMLLLEFEESVNMDTISVDIQQAIATLSASWDDMVGTPYVLKINPSMLPVEVAAVSMEGMSTVELTDFMNDTLMNKLEGIEGVARISTNGMIQQELHIVLDQQWIDARNVEIRAAITGQLNEAAADLESAREELKDAQNQIENAKEQLEAGQDILAEQTSQGEAELNYQQTQILSTKAELGDQLAQIRSGKSQLETMLKVLKALQNGLHKLESEKAALEAELEKLETLQRTLDALEALRDEMDAQMEEIRQDIALSGEEIEAAVEAFRQTPAYLEMEAAWVQLQVELAVFNLSVEDLKPYIETLQAAMETLNERMQELEQTLQEQNLSVETLDDAVAEMEGQLTQMDTGIAALEDALKQLDAGLLQMKDAQALLSEQKTIGLMEMTQASVELAVNGSTLTAALEQVEGGLDTLQSSRESALKKADLNQILTIDMISTILTAQNFSMPAGYVEQEGISYMLSIGDPIEDAETLENLMLFNLGIDGVQPVYLKDVAAVMVTDNRNETYAKLNQENGIILSFEKQSTYATAETTNNIAERFEELEGEYPGLSFEALMNQGDYIYLIVNTIFRSLLLGAVFAIVILFLFLKDLRPTFITLCSIPISVIFAIVLMYFSGVTINMISLSGLAVAVGMLVDNSVVVIENIYRLRSNGANAIQAAVFGAKQVAGAVISSTLTTVCVFLPIVFVEGLTRQIFTDLALTMTYSLMASLIVALTLVPAMAGTMLREEKKTKHPLMDRMSMGYETLIRLALKHKIVVLVGSLALLILSGTLCVRKGFIFMPEMDMPNVTVTVTMPEDAEMEECAAIADEVLAKIAQVEGLATVGAMMDSGTMMLGGSGDSGSGHSMTAYITLADQTASGAAVAKEIEGLCADMGVTVTATSEMMDTSMLFGGSGIAVEIYADNMERLQNAAKETAKVLASVEGVAESDDGLQDAAPALHIQVDRNKAMEKGLTVAQIYMELASQLTGSTTGTSIELEGTKTTVVIEKPAGAVPDVKGLEDYIFEVEGQDGTITEVALADIAEIKESTSLNTISRLNQRRYLTVSASLAEGENITLVTAKAEKAMEQADLGEGVTYVFTGENESIVEAVEQLLLMLLLGILLVYLVMVAQFQSLKSPFIVMFTIPLAFTGGFVGLLLCGMEVSVVSLIGFVMLVGIIVNNGIVLVDYINQLRQDGMERRAALVEAGKTRMRPILMTSITTVLGLLDMALSNAAGNALMRPVAVVCIGGLLYATLMTLFVVPCIYDLFNKKEIRVVRDEDLQLNMSNEKFHS